MAAKKIFMVEDHTLFREGLKSLLGGNTGFEIVGEAPDGVQAIQCLDTQRPDLVLLDLSMPKRSGLSVLREIKQRFPQIRVLVLTIHESDRYILEAFEAGADGYCLKDAGRDELLRAIDSVLQGIKFISPTISDKVMEGALHGRKKLKAKATWDTVTRREKEVLKLLAQGVRNRQIADLLQISVKTVEKHRSNIRTKLDLHSLAALTAYALDQSAMTESNQLSEMTPEPDNEVRFGD